MCWAPAAGCLKPIVRLLGWLCAYMVGWTASAQFPVLDGAREQCYWQGQALACVSLAATRAGVPAAHMGSVFSAVLTREGSRMGAVRRVAGNSSREVPAVQVHKVSGALQRMICTEQGFSVPMQGRHTARWPGVAYRWRLTRTITRWAGGIRGKAAQSGSFCRVGGSAAGSRALVDWEKEDGMAMVDWEKEDGGLYVLVFK